MTVLLLAEVAPKLRRAALNAAESKVNASTQREQAEHRGEMYGYLKALELLVQAGVSTPGIEKAASNYDNGTGLAFVIQFLGDYNASQLGFVE